MSNSWTCVFSTTDCLIILHHDINHQQETTKTQQGRSFLSIHCYLKPLLCPFSPHMHGHISSSWQCPTHELVFFFYILLPRTSLKNYYSSFITTPATTTQQWRCFLSTYCCLKPLLLPFPHLHGHICSSWQCPTHELVFLPTSCCPELPWRTTTYLP